jgi:hypothetical protein
MSAAVGQGADEEAGHVQYKAAAAEVGNEQEKANRYRVHEARKTAAVILILAESAVALLAVLARDVQREAQSPRRFLRSH